MSLQRNASGNNSQRQQRSRDDSKSTSGNKHPYPTPSKENPKKRRQPSQNTSRMQSSDEQESPVRFSNAATVLYDASRPRVHPSTQHHPSTKQRAFRPSSQQDDIRSVEGEYDLEDVADDETMSRTSSDIVPWGNLKSRAGRGELYGQVLASKHDVTLAVNLLINAWASGEKGLEWKFWPDEDMEAFAEAIRNCWAQVVELEEGGVIYATHHIEPLVGRKMKDSVGDKRSQIMARIRMLVYNEFDTQASHIPEESRREFWETLERDHAVLSPDTNRPGYKKWLSEIVVKCLACLFGNPNTLAAHRLTLHWFRPIRPYTIVWISTLILHAVNERASGSGVLKLDGRGTMGTFLKIKHSWQGMPNNKQQTICQMLTSKVERMVAKPLLIEDTKAVPNVWNDTLDDLQDDPDFPKPVLDCSNSRKTELRRESCNDDSIQSSHSNKGEEDSSPNSENDGRDDGREGDNESEKEQDNDSEKEQDNGSSTDDELGRDNEVVQGNSEDYSEHSPSEGLAQTSNQSDSSDSVVKGKGTRKPSSSKGKRPAGVVHLHPKTSGGRRSTRNTQARNEITQNIDGQSIKAKVGKGQKSHVCMLHQGITFQKLQTVTRLDDSILFYSDEATYSKHGTGHGAHALSTDEDIERMVETALAKGWPCVHIFDSEDQFPDDKE